MVAQGLRLLRRLGGSRVDDLGLVDGNAAQEAGLRIVVVLDHLQHERADLLAVPDEREEQPVGVAELGAIELSVIEVAELFYVGCAEIAAADRFRHSAIRIGNAGGVEADVFEDLHGGVIVRRDFTSSHCTRTVVGFRAAEER